MSLILCDFCSYPITIDVMDTRYVRVNMPEDEGEWMCTLCADKALKQNEQTLNFLKTFWKDKSSYEAQ